MQAKRSLLSLFLLSAVCVAAPVAIGESVEACTPAEQASTARAEQTVLADLAAGKTYEQTEADVASIFAGQPGADAVVILNDVLQFLIDAGVIPAGSLSVAKSMLSEGHAKLAARRP